MPSVSKQLSVNVTTSNTWTQLTEFPGLGGYVVPGTGRAIAKNLRASNHGGVTVTVEFAISIPNPAPPPATTVTDNELLFPAKSILTLEELTDTGPHVVPQGYALYGRSVGAAVNVTFSASILEVTP